MSILSRLKPHKMVMVLALALVLAGAFALPVRRPPWTSPSDFFPVARFHLPAACHR